MGLIRDWWKRRFRREDPLAEEEELEKEEVMDRESTDFSDEQLAFEIKRFALMPESEYLGFCSGARRYWSENFCAERNYKSFWDSILNAERTVSL